MAAGRPRGFKNKNTSKKSCQTGLPSCFIHKPALLVIICRIFEPIKNDKGFQYPVLKAMLSRREGRILREGTHLVYQVQKSISTRHRGFFKPPLSFTSDYPHVTCQNYHALRSVFRINTKSRPSRAGFYVYLYRCRRGLFQNSIFAKR